MIEIYFLVMDVPCACLLPLRTMNGLCVSFCLCCNMVNVPNGVSVELIFIMSCFNKIKAKQTFNSNNSNRMLFSVDPIPYCTYSVLLALFQALFDLVLTRPLAMEFMRQVAEGFFLIQQSTIVVDILKLNIWLVIVFLFEIVCWATMETITTVELIILSEMNE